jgi:hypothetical protein
MECDFENVLVYYHSADHLCRGGYFHVAVREVFGRANRAMDPGLGSTNLKGKIAVSIAFFFILFYRYMLDWNN